MILLKILYTSGCQRMSLASSSIITWELVRKESFLASSQSHLIRNCMEKEEGSKMQGLKEDGWYVSNLLKQTLPVILMSYKVSEPPLYTVMSFFLYLRVIYFTPWYFSIFLSLLWDNEPSFTCLAVFSYICL